MNFFYDILLTRLLTERMVPAAQMDEIMWHLNQGYIDEIEARMLMDTCFSDGPRVNAKGGIA